MTINNPKYKQLDGTNASVQDFLSDLQGAGGSSELKTLQTGAGAVSRTIAAKLNQTVSVLDFGADPTGTTNAVPAILAAAVALGSSGGTIVVPNNCRLLIDTSLTLPHGVGIQGPYEFVGSQGSNQIGTLYGIMSGLIINPAVSIFMQSNSGLKGLFIQRKGMVFPVPNTAAFAGTAIQIIGDPTYQIDDVFISQCMIVGFDNAVYAYYSSRPRITDCLLDNVGGIHIEQCADIPHLHACHSWPFTTIAAYAAAGGGLGPPGTSALLRRAGTAYKFSNVGDWNKITNCFSYGWFRGYVVNNCNSITFSGCGADNTPLEHVGAIGFLIQGNSDDTRIVNCQAAAQAIGYYIDTTANTNTRIMNSDTWVNIDHGMVIGAGNVSVIGGMIRNVPNGITVTNASAYVSVDNVKFNTIPGAAIATSASTSRLFVGKNDYGNIAAGTPAIGGAGATTTAITSAGTVALPSTGDNFTWNGSTNCGSIFGGWAGRRITLVFTGTPVMLNSTGATTAMRLSAGGNFTATVGATLTLMHNGVQWYEVSRSA